MEMANLPSKLCPGGGEAKEITSHLLWQYISLLGKI